MKESDLERGVKKVIEIETEIALRASMDRTCVVRDAESLDAESLDAARAHIRDLLISATDTNDKMGGGWLIDAAICDAAYNFLSKS